MGFWRRVFGRRASVAEEAGKVAGPTEQSVTVVPVEELYRAGVALIEPLLEIMGRPVVRLGSGDAARLRRGIELLDRVIEIVPHNWAAMWVVGKAHQRLEEFDQAFGKFRQAFRINPGNPNVSREASIMAMECGRLDEALPFCNAAIAADPNDVGLRANLALVLLFSGQVEEAVAVAEDALRREPADAITQRIVGVCKAVQSGKRPCPRHRRDIL
jgi:tetratricopeptide (TPR) repeat protein